MLLVGGVGYSDLGDLSFGPSLVARADRRSWPSSLCFEDLSYNPIAAVEWFRERQASFERAVLVGAAQRGRQPGSLSRVRWVESPRTLDEVQARVAEAVTGTISLENLLVIGGHFGVLPPQVEVVELEPVSSEPMNDLSETAEQRLSELLERLAEEALSLTATNRSTARGVAAS